MRKDLLVSLVCLLSVFGGCSDDIAAGLPAQRSGTNEPPSISGKPARNAAVRDSYSFAPEAYDPEGKALKFSIAHKPLWASFDARTGRLTGTPDTADVGTHERIVISASDGRNKISLPAFDISVDSWGDRSITLSWLPPTMRTDGSVLSNLAGYHIYYGRTASSLEHVIRLKNPGLTRHVVENLSPGRWYLAMTSIDSKGNESGRTAAVSKKVG